MWPGDIADGSALCDPCAAATCYRPGLRAINRTGGRSGQCAGECRSHNTRGAQQYGAADVGRWRALEVTHSRAARRAVSSSSSSSSDCSEPHWHYCPPLGLERATLLSGSAHGPPLLNAHTVELDVAHPSDVNHASGQIGDEPRCSSEGRGCQQPSLQTSHCAGTASALHPVGSNVRSPRPSFSSTPGMDAQRPPHPNAVSAGPRRAA